MSSSEDGASSPKCDIYLPFLLSCLAKKIEQDPQAWPSSAEIVAVLVRNALEPIPPTVLAHIEDRLEGTARKRRGRKRTKLIHAAREQMIYFSYFRYLTWLTAREKRERLQLDKQEKSQTLVGWRMIRKAEWWQGPPSERAARMARQKWNRTITWETVQKTAYQMRKELEQLTGAPNDVFTP